MGFTHIQVKNKSMTSAKFACAALFALAVVACVGFFVANDEVESIKYMPSVGELTGTNIFASEDNSSDSSDDDDDTGAASESTGDSFASMFGESSDNAASDDSSDASSSGASLSDGDDVTVQYKLRLADSGKEVYRQWGEGDGGSFDFQLGGGHVIPGFDSAVSGMSVGETKTVTIPSDEAYGSKGFAGMGIGPNQDLEYTLKVVSKN